MIESFTVEEIRKLLAVIDINSYIGFREALIIQFLLDICKVSSTLIK